MALETNRFIEKAKHSQIELANRIFRCERELYFKMEDNDYSVKMLFPNNNYIPTSKSGVCVEDKLLYEFSIEDKFISHLLIGNGNIDQLNRIPEKLKYIALEVAFEQLLDCFEKHCHCNTTFVELPTNHLNNNDNIFLKFKIICETEKSEFYGAICTDHEGASWLFERYEQLPRAASTKFNQVPLTVKFECGYSLMNFSEIANIELHDIILIDDGISPSKSHIVINIGPSLALIGQVEFGKKITILQINNIQMENAMDTRKTSDTVLDDTQIGDIPVHLIFQVGETQLKFGDLMHLQPGYTFELENELSQQVEIKANGKTIGIGELVEIGDRLGVRVVEFERKHV